MGIIQTSIQPNIQAQFKRSLRWTLSGSLIYETIKFAHCFLLLQLLPQAIYGVMGSLFSLIYLTTYIADLGATNSIPPFFHLFTQSKYDFKRFLLVFSLAPHLPILCVCAAGATIFASIKFSTLPYILLIPTIIILETTRSFLRLLLHTTFQAKRAVAVEVILFLLYLGIIWIPYLIFESPITLNKIFIPHLIDSALAVALFSLLIRKYYKRLHPAKESTLPHNLAKRLAVTRLFNYLLRVGRNFFTSNFLTPLFAIKFGLSTAGLFYFASTLINAIQAVVKSVIGYSGNALLANLKTSTQESKREAFVLLSQKLILVLAPFIIVLSTNYKSILRLSRIGDITSYTMALALLFMILAFLEFFFVLYEQFYIIEEAANKLFYFKLFEFALFYGLISSAVTSNPVATLIGLIVIRVTSLIIIALNAFYWWKIKPNFKTNLWYLFSWVIVALVLAWVLPASP